MLFSQPARISARIRPAKRPVRPRLKNEGRGPRTRVELLFDSFATPAFGARSTARTQRNLLYRAEPYQIDLLIEPQPESNRLRITGQLLDTSDPALFGQGVKVTLWDGLQSFVFLRTSEWGEFLGEIENSGELIVALKIAAREIVISIQNVLS
jgi:hypothetical protein